jgi:hypothetical protein
MQTRWTRKTWAWLGIFLLLCGTWMGVTQAATSSGSDAAPSPAGKAAGAKQAAADAAAAPSTPEQVTVGMYFNDVQAIDLRQHNYLVDFYIWFRWRDPDIDPSASMEFVNHSESWSTVQTPAFEKPEKLPDGTLYQVKHIQGKMSRKMVLHDYPFDRQVIQVVIEDVSADISRMRYHVDKVSVNADLKLPGFLYAEPALKAYDYTHQTTFGDPRSPTASTYSRLSFELPISRPHVNAFMKNILPILLAVICCSFVFLLHPSLVDSRFQVAVVSLLSIVALQITSSSELPTIEYMTLLDNLYVIGYFYCISVVAALTWSTKLSHIHDGVIEPQYLQTARRFDRLAGAALFGLYLVASLWTMRPLFA